MCRGPDWTARTGLLDDRTAIHRHHLSTGAAAQPPDAPGLATRFLCRAPALVARTAIGAREAAGKTLSGQACAMAAGTCQLNRGSAHVRREGRVSLGLRGWGRVR